MSDCGFVANDPVTPIGARLRAWRLGHGLDERQAARRLLLRDGDVEAIEAKVLEPDGEHAETLGRMMDFDAPPPARDSRGAAARPGPEPIGQALDVPGNATPENADGTSALEEHQRAALGLSAYPSIMRSERGGAALARLGGEGFVQFQFARTGGCEIIAMPVEAARTLLADAAAVIAIHDNPKLFEGEESA